MTTTTEIDARLAQLVAKRDEARAQSLECTRIAWQADEELHALLDQRGTG